ncbi:HNH endonuclease [Chloroflexota bacterium]
MPNPRRKVKDEFWFGAIFIALIVYALLAEWWKEHSVLGWIILGVLVAVAGYILYRYASLRGWLGRQVKDTVQKAVFEKVASDREPLTQYERNAVLRRAQYKCENERCNFQGKPHIHHIDANNQNNKLGNLIALCPNCHQKAHDGKFTESQLFNWARRDYKRLQARRAQR